MCVDGLKCEGPDVHVDGEGICVRPGSGKQFESSHNKIFAICFRIFG